MSYSTDCYYGSSPERWRLRHTRIPRSDVKLSPCSNGCVTERRRKRCRGAVLVRIGSRSIEFVTTPANAAVATKSQVLAPIGTAVGR